MGIVCDDIKYYKASNQTESDMGGGAPGDEIVVSGEVNNLFPNVSRTDRAGGRIQLRKAFVKVDTNTNDTYSGSHTIVKYNPEDENVNVMLIPATTVNDTREDITDYINTYMVTSIPVGNVGLSSAVAAGSMNLSFLTDSEVAITRMGNAATNYEPIIEVAHTHKQLDLSVGNVIYLENDGGDTEFAKVAAVETMVQEGPAISGNCVADEDASSSSGTSNPVAFNGYFSILQDLESTTTVLNSTNIQLPNISKGLWERYNGVINGTLDRYEYYYAPFTDSTTHSDVTKFLPASVDWTVTGYDETLTDYITVTEITLSAPIGVSLSYFRQNDNDVYIGNKLCLLGYLGGASSSAPDTGFICQSIPSFKYTYKIATLSLRLQYAYEIGTIPDSTVINPVWRWYGASNITAISTDKKEVTVDELDKPIYPVIARDTTVTAVTPYQVHYYDYEYGPTGLEKTFTSVSGSNHIQLFDIPAGSINFSFNTYFTGIKPESFRMIYMTDRERVVMNDDGSGGLSDKDGGSGTVDYDSGAVSVSLSHTLYVDESAGSKVLVDHFPYAQRAVVQNINGAATSSTEWLINATSLESFAYFIAFSISAANADNDAGVPAIDIKAENRNGALYVVHRPDYIAASSTTYSSAVSVMDCGEYFDGEYSFVSAGDTYISTDGLNYTKFNDGTATRYHRRLTISGTYIRTLSDAGAVASTYTLPTSSSTQSVYSNGLAIGSGAKFVVMGRSSAGIVKIAYSEDRTNWTEVDLDFAAYMYGIGYGPVTVDGVTQNEFVAVSADGHGIHSWGDLDTWSSFVSPTFTTSDEDHFLSLVCDTSTGIWAMACDANNVYTSATGCSQWASATSFLPNASDQIIDLSTNHAGAFYATLKSTTDNNTSLWVSNDNGSTFSMFYEFASGMKASEGQFIAKNYFEGVPSGTLADPMTCSFVMRYTSTAATPFTFSDPVIFDSSGDPISTAFGIVLEDDDGKQEITITHADIPELAALRLLYALRIPSDTVVYCPELPLYEDGIQRPLSCSAYTYDMETQSLSTDSEGVGSGPGSVYFNAEYGLIAAVFDEPIARQTASFGYSTKQFSAYNESFEFDEIDGIDTRPLPLTGKIPIFNPGDKLVVRDASSGSEDMGLITGVSRNSDGGGVLSLAAELIHDYTVPDENNILMACSVNMHGDLMSDVTTIFTQESWDSSSWADTQSGNPADGTYNYADYPITCKNLGAVTERWQIQITGLSPLRGSVRGEYLGVIAADQDLESLLSPANPNISGGVYFSVMAGGWGLGWQVGNILRFNTDGAAHPDWVCRVINVGASDSINDSGHLMIRGDVPLGSGDVLTSVSSSSATVTDGSVAGDVDTSGSAASSSVTATSGAITGIVDETGSAAISVITVTAGAVTGSVS